MPAALADNALQPFQDGMKKFFGEWQGMKSDELADVDLGRALDQQSVEQLLKYRQESLQTFIYRAAMGEDAWWTLFAPFEKTDTWTQTLHMYYSTYRPWRNITQEVLPEITPITEETLVEGLMMFGQAQETHLDNLKTAEGRDQFWQKVRHLSSNLRVTFRFNLEAVLANSPSFFIQLVQSGIDGEPYHDLMSAFEHEKNCYLAPHRADIGLEQCVRSGRDMIERSPGPKPDMVVFPSRFAGYNVASSPGFQLSPHERGTVAEKQLTTLRYAPENLANFEVHYDDEQLGYHHQLEQFSNSFRTRTAKGQFFGVHGPNIKHFLPELRERKADLDFLLSIEIPCIDGERRFSLRDNLWKALPVRQEGSEDIHIDWGVPAADRTADNQAENWDALESAHAALDYTWPFDRRADFANAAYSGQIRWMHLFKASEPDSKPDLSDERLFELENHKWNWLRLHARTAAIAAGDLETVAAAHLQGLSTAANRAGVNVVLTGNFSTTMARFVARTYQPDAERVLDSAIAAAEYIKYQTSHRHLAIYGDGIGNADTMLGGAGGWAQKVESLFLLGPDIAVGAIAGQVDLGTTPADRSKNFFGHEVKMSQLTDELGQLSDLEVICALVMLFTKAEKLQAMGTPGDSNAPWAARKVAVKQMQRMIDNNVLPPKDSMLVFRPWQNIDGFALAFLRKGAAVIKHAFGSTVMTLNGETLNILVVATIYGRAFVRETTDHFLEQNVFSAGNATGWGNRVLDPTTRDPIPEVEGEVPPNTIVPGVVDYANNHADMLVWALTGFSRDYVEPYKALQYFGRWNPDIIASVFQPHACLPHLPGQAEFPGGHYFGRQQFNIDLDQANADKGPPDGSLASQSTSVSVYNALCWMGTQYEANPITRQHDIVQIGNFHLSHVTTNYRRIFSREAVVRDDKYLTRKRKEV